MGSDYYLHAAHTHTKKDFSLVMACGWVVLNGSLGICFWAQKVHFRFIFIFTNNNKRGSEINSWMIFMPNLHTRSFLRLNSFRLPDSKQHAPYKHIKNMYLCHGSRFSALDSTRLWSTLIISFSELWARDQRFTSSHKIIFYCLLCHDKISCAVTLMHAHSNPRGPVRTPYAYTQRSNINQIVFARCHHDLFALIIIVVVGETKTKTEKQKANFVRLRIFSRYISLISFRAT